ncbi:MAG: ribosome maturation factor RimP [Coriobacteriia bacterium]|nr:ribosome maturation factor RimP [Coriobacteriia bacterium]
MTKNDRIAHVTAALEAEAASHGFELVAIEQTGGKGVPVLRVLLDREGGITLDQVAEANEWVSELLDAQEPFSGPYTLEVSSPGVDRPLVKPADFVRFAGEDVHIKTAASESRKSWHGVLIGMEGDDIVIDVEGERVTIPFDTVQKARLKGVVDFGKGRGAV